MSAESKSDNKASIAAAVKDVKSLRSHQMGVVRTYLNKIDQFIAYDDSTNVAACEEIVKKLKPSLERFDILHDDAVKLMSKYSQDIKKIVQQAVDLRSDVVKSTSDSQRWIDIKEEMSSTIIEAENRQTLSSSTAFPQDMSSIPRVELQTTHCRDADDYETLVKSRESEITQLQQEVNRLSVKSRDFGKIEDQLDDAKDVIQQQKRDHEDEERQYLGRIKYLEDKIKAQESQDQTAGHQRPGPSFDTSRGNTSMTQQDIMAMSTVIGQTNSDMMKKLLEESHSQQQQFFTHITGPKVVLQKFDGDRTQFMSFVNRFDEMVGKTERSFSSKLSTLMEHCTPQVLTYLDSCNYKDAREGYLLARQILQERYGNPYLISQAWVAKLAQYTKLRTADQMHQFSAVITSAYEALNTMGFGSELSCTRTMKEIYEKLPGFVQNKWLAKNREQSQKGRNATFQQLIELITNAAHEMNDPVYGQVSKPIEEKKKSNEKERFRSTKTATQTSDRRNSSSKQKETTSRFAATGETDARSRDLPPCVMCNKPHPTYKCFLYKDLGAGERLDFVMKHRLCIRCINPGHHQKDCPRAWTCLMADCDEPHHFSLHRALTKRGGESNKARVNVVQATSKIEDDDDDDESDDDPVTKRPVMMNISRVVKVKPCYSGLRVNTDFILPVIPIILQNENGGFLRSYAMLDTGSCVTMITKYARDKLKLKAVARASMLLAGVNSEVSLETDVVDVTIRGTQMQQSEGLRSVIVNDQMIFDPNQVMEMKKYAVWEHLKHIDMKHNLTNRVDILIGQDQAFLLVHSQKLEGPSQYFPIGVETRLGWTVYGHMSKEFEYYEAVTPCNVVVKTMDEDEKLSQTLEELWEIDRIPDTPGFSPINQRILKRWKREARLVDGHVQVPIPFKNEPPCLPDNYGPVKARLDALGRRLQRDEVLKKQCVQAMRKNIELGFLEMGPEDPDPDYLHYNPQQAVLSDTRTTTCRIVGNLSFKYRNVSLNEVVHQGPNLASPIVQVMIGFRLYKYVITADIEKMFNQVHVPEYQRDCLSVLWWKDDEPGNQVVVYRGRTQMFGGTWSPSASMYAMEMACDLYGAEYSQLAVQAVQKGFYVDDLLRSITSISIGIRLMFEVRDLLSKVGFNLTKFGSNAIEIVEQIPVELRSKKYEAIEFVLHDGMEDKTLGSLWKPAEDEFGVVLNRQDKPLTRRGLLSSFSTIYDPMGYVGPVVLLAKLLIQELCRMGLTWDEDIPEDYVQRWLMWREELPCLQSFTVTRWLGVDPEKGNDYQLHVFADASTSGYGAVVYLCELDDSGQIIGSNIVMSKSKVAPLKSMTIPRLELSAAVVAAKLEHMIVGYMDIPLLPSVFWIDSKIVLYYVKQQSREYKTFVANRIAVIQELTDPSQWRYVPSALNAADMVSRGIGAKAFVEFQEWKTGPRFLRNIDEWPDALPDMPEPEDAERSQRKRVHYVASYVFQHVGMRDKGFTRFLSGFSQWNKMIRAVANLKRMVNKFRGNKLPSGRITVEEFVEAEKVVVRHMQFAFITESQRKSPCFRKLYPFDDAEGMWRVGGRLMLSELMYEEKHPMLMPQCAMSQAYIRHVHARLGHPGIDRTYYETRRHYWILGGRKYVKSVLNSCVLCKKMKSKPPQQLMAPLPGVRVNPGKAPFEHVGIDYFGPISVRIGRSNHKRWGCVITDMQSRAMHIELAGELSTSSFLNALQRFIARRGRPLTIKSDNGSNFVGAKRELRKLFDDWNKNQIHDFLMQEHIDWSFNTPYASHHGGVWERQIRTIRQLMMSLIKEQTLTDESLSTYMCLIEEMINSRPLTRMSEDPGDLLPITPNHLLMLRQTQGLTGNYQKSDTIQRRWRQLQYLADIFWKRWSRSYVKSLQERSKWNEEQPSVQVGDLVLLVDDQLPRLSWPLAKVIRVFPGRDNLVRSVRLKTQTGEYERPISKIIALECNY